jgi:sugar lactone lactonase YvrE
MTGKPSSIKLDAKRQILYWTDIENNQIGRIFLDENRIEPNFITKTGKYPDGLAVDTIRNKIYWVSSHESLIGWSFASSPKPHLIKLNESPNAVEVDPINGDLYFSLWKADKIRKIHLDKNKVEIKVSVIDTYPAGGASPGVLKIFNLTK